MSLSQCWLKALRKKKLFKRIFFFLQSLCFPWLNDFDLLSSLNNPPVLLPGPFSLGVQWISKSNSIFSNESCGGGVIACFGFSVLTSTIFDFPKTSSKFYYYGYSKIVLPQLHTKCIFLCLVFLIDLLTYSY